MKNCSFRSSKATMAPLRGFEAKTLLFLVGLALISCGAQAARRGLVDNGATVFDVTTYGAKPDNGQTDNSMAFIQAWNAACKSTGAAKLVIPPGTFMTSEVFFYGPCTCQTPIIVEVEGTVLAQSDLSEFPDNQWISVRHVDSLIIQGQGTLHGQGEAVWKFDSCGGKTKCDSRLPATIVFSDVSNSIVQGISLVNSKGFNLKICDSSNFTVQNITITAPADSPNTDGIHISRSNQVTILGCTIGTGDDCISIGEGATNVSVSGITCGPGHGISIGSLGLRPDEHDVSGIVVKNCTLTNTTNGARIKSWHQSPRIQASNIVFEDLVMNEVRNPIFIDQHYGSKKKPGSSLVKISDVHFKNIRGTTISTNAVALSCSDVVPCEGIELVDIDLSYTGGSTIQNFIFSSACEHAIATFSGKQNPPPCK
ncbi:unnamed protein product [Camellia sinensis]